MDLAWISRHGSRNDIDSRSRARIRMCKPRHLGHALCSHAVTLGRSVRSSARAVLAGLLLSAALYATPSYAQEWPQQTARLVLPFGPASAADIAARVMSDGLAARWGKPVIVENKPGAD